MNPDEARVGARATLAAAGDISPGCGVPACLLCHPRPVCPGFLGLNTDRFCLRCSWARHRHEETP